MRKEQKRNGFTLVEVIVVLVILAALIIPAMAGWIDKAREKRLIVSCRACVLVTQTLLTEKYGASGTATAPGAAKVTELAGVDGLASNIAADENAATVDMLTYTEGSESVTYERLPKPRYTYGADASGYTTQAVLFSGYVRQRMQNNRKTKLASKDKSDLYKEYYASNGAVAMSDEYKLMLFSEGLLPSRDKKKDLYWWSYPVTDANSNLLYTVTFANEYGSD